MRNPTVQVTPTLGGAAEIEGKKLRWIVYTIIISLIVIFNVSNLYKFQEYYTQLFTTIATTDGRVDNQLECNCTSNNSAIYDEQHKNLQQVNNTETSPHTGKDWYNRERFDALFKDTCKVVDNICHSSGRWWYKTLADGGGGIQPSFIFITDMKDGPAYPPNITVLSDSDVDTDVQLKFNNKCTISPIINHISMYSHYNTMLGEFYSRILVGLFEMSQTVPDNFTDFLQETQLYLHLFEKNDKSLMDSHHIFSDAFRGNPLLDAKRLLDNSGCQCVRRLFFCGYSFSTANLTVDGDSPKVLSISGGSGISSSSPSADTWNKLRQAILKGIVEENPFMQEDIKYYREKTLQDKGASGNLTEWKIIGLSQRNGRRKWKNLDKIEEQCNKDFRQHKIICTEVNVEKKYFYPYYQAVVHGGLDALYGIHGAQLTEAIWMKPGSLVVELLPWVHEKMIMGPWTREVCIQCLLWLWFMII
jgi:hypothetical protein